MSLYLLLDLDDTLLTNDMDRFIPAYIDRLAAYMAEHAPARQFVSELMNATRLMMANGLPDRTLKEVFDGRFYPSLGLERDNVAGDLEKFYTSIFPKLASVTEQVADAPDLIAETRQRDYCLVVATNPLFPRLATLERIQWAGLDADDFCLITTYESFHFAKPNPAYYAEILGQLGWPQGPIIMAGNDPENDIKPAQKLGLATYWVNPETLNLSNPRQAAGPLAELLDWIDQYPSENFQPDYQSAESIQAVLTSTPAVLDSLLAGVPDRCWQAKPGQDDWAITEIICHLRDVDREVNLPRIQRLLNIDNPFIEGADTDPWAKTRNYLEQDGPLALKDFVAARIEILNKLIEMPEAAWQRPARHAIFGPTNLEEICRIIAEHDRLHIRQISSLLQTDYCS